MNLRDDNTVATVSIVDKEKEREDNQQSVGLGNNTIEEVVNAIKENYAFDQNAINYDIQGKFIGEKIPDGDTTSVPNTSSPRIEGNLVGLNTTSTTTTTTNTVGEEPKKEEVNNTPVVADVKETTTTPTTTVETPKVEETTTTVETTTNNSVSTENE